MTTEQERAAAAEQWHLISIMNALVSCSGCRYALDNPNHPAIKTRRIDYREHCREDAEIHCTVSGELVASWTGPDRTVKGVILPISPPK